MNQSNIEEMAERLAAVERALHAAQDEMSELRKNWRQTIHRRATLMMVVIATGILIAMWGRTGITYAQGPGQWVDAPFRVKGSNGRVLFQISEEEEGVQATLWNKEAQPVAAVMAISTGGRFLAAGPDAMPRASIGVTDSGDGAMAIWNRDNEAIADIIRGSRGQGLGVYDKEGNNKVEVATTSTNAAVIRLKSEYSDLATSLYVDNNNSGIFVRDPASDLPIATVGLESPSSPEGQTTPPREGLVVFGSGGQPVASVYQNQVDSGTVAVWKGGAEGQDSNKNSGAAFGVGDQGPVLRVTDKDATVALAVVNGKPEIDLTAADLGLVQIKQGDTGGGYLALANSAGNAMVEAGVGPTGTGVVRTFPFNGMATGILGLPGTYIAGRPKQ